MDHQENKVPQVPMVEWDPLVKLVHKDFVENQETLDHQE